MNDFFLVAEIKSVFGVDGFVSIESFSDFDDRFFELKMVYIEIFGNRKQFSVESVKIIDKKIILKFSGFNSDADVQVFLGKKIFVDSENLIQLESDNFFIHDLLNSVVFRNDVEIGLVEDVYVLPANDVLVVNDKNSKKILIPAVKDYIKRFDAEMKRLELVNDCDLLYDDEN